MMKGIRSKLKKERKKDEGRAIRRNKRGGRGNEKEDGVESRGKDERKGTK